MTGIENEAFTNAKEKVGQTMFQMQGIGTLSEKTVHSVLKYYYQPDDDYHEVGVGNYVADICVDNDIVEIQTANFNKLRPKLDEFLKENNVTIVYPIPCVKWLIWRDVSNGEIVSRRKSPKKGTPYSVFYELYKIKNYLSNPKLHLRIVMMDVEEERCLDGWSNDKKKGSHRIDRNPIAIVEEINIEYLKDYLLLLPYDMPEVFSTKDYSKAAKVSPRVASLALNVLASIDIICRTGKKGNLILYKVNEELFAS